MDFKTIGWDKIALLFGWAVLIVGGLYKAVIFLIDRNDRKKKEKQEQARIDKTDGANILKASLEHEFKLEELADKKIWQLMELQAKEIDQLKGDKILLNQEIEKWEASDEKRKVVYLQKLFLLREHQRELQLLEAEILKGEISPEFQNEILKRIATLRVQTEDHEKLLS